MTVKQLIALLQQCGEDEEVRIMSDPEGNDEHPVESVGLRVADESPTGKPQTILWPGYDPRPNRR